MMTRGSGRRVAATAVLMVTAFASPAIAQDARIAGTVADASGGALPGVTVTALAPGSEPLVVATDATGRYELSGLQPGPVTISFALEGFETLTEETIAREAATVTFDRRLALATLHENVSVVAAAPPPPAPPPPPVPPLPAVQPVPEPLLASVCGPARAEPDEQPLAKVTGRYNAGPKLLYGDRDVLVLDAGTSQGLTVGRNLVVRRRFPVDVIDPMTLRPLEAEHSSGLVQVVEARADRAIAVAVYVCDEFALGDDVYPFEPVPLVAAPASGAPDFERAARVIFGDEGRLLGSPRQMMVIDRGDDLGLRPGDRLTLFRPDESGNLPIVLGHAIVTLVQPYSARILIEQATDAIYPGDAAAPHGPPLAAASGATDGAHADLPR